MPLQRHDKAARDELPRHARAGQEQLLAKGNYDKGEYAIVAEVEPEYQFTKVEHTVSAEAMLVDAMISGGVSGRDAIAAVLADPNNSYSKTS